jgi:hypothetical protein
VVIGGEPDQVAIVPPVDVTDAMERLLLSVVVVTDAQSGCTGFYNLTHGWQLLAAEGHWSWHQFLWTIEYFPFRHVEALSWLESYVSIER